MELTSAKILNDKRIDKFRQQITDVLEQDNVGIFKEIVEQYQQEHNIPAIEIAAALAKIAQGDTPLLVKDKPTQNRAEFREDSSNRDRPSRKTRTRSNNPKHDKPPEDGMARFRLEVGHQHQVMPGNIVGAIANEAGLDSKYIGRINIFDDYSTVDMPDEMPDEIFKHLQTVRVSGQKINITKLTDDKKKVSYKKDKDNKSTSKEDDFKKRKKRLTSKEKKGKLKKAEKKKSKTRSQASDSES